MFKSFVSKIYTIYAVVTLIVFISLVSFVMYVIDSTTISQELNKMNQYGESINQFYQDKTTVVNPDYFKYIVNIMGQTSGYRIVITDIELDVFTDTQRILLQGQRLTVDQPNINKALEGKKVSAVHALGSGAKAITLVVPISNTHYNTAALIFIQSRVASVMNIANPFFKLTVICLLISLLFSLMLMYLFSRRINKVFNQMNRTAKSIANGNFESRIMIQGDDEFSELATNLNYMAAELGKLEEMRRSFIANISHDFRSPLTSIKGFVQAILDGTIPPENQGKYLNIVLNESDRLTNLTNDILLLTKLENNGISIEKQSFDIHSLVREVIIQFEQKIMEKKMEIILLIDERAILVDADREKIQRVLYNIIDNAVKFCGKGDRLTIETTKFKDKVNISIKDTGPGINEEDIKYIFNRFHKADRSRGMDKKGTGLGLSIVKEIMNAHNESINVNSQLNKGTEFIFTLSLYKMNKSKNKKL